MPLVLHKQRHRNVLALAQVFQQEIQVANVTGNTLQAQSDALPLALRVRFLTREFGLLLLLLLLLLLVLVLVLVLLLLLRQSLLQLLQLYRQRALTSLSRLQLGRKCLAALAFRAAVIARA